MGYVHPLHPSRDILHAGACGYLALACPPSCDDEHRSWPSAAPQRTITSRYASLPLGPATPLVPALLERPPDGLDRVVVSKRHLSEVSRPSGDIIGRSPAHPFGLSRAYHTRHLPPSSFLSSSTACASADLPALFHAGATHGVSRTGLPSSRRGWRRETDEFRSSPSSMAALPKLNCNARKSALERGLNAAPPTGTGRETARGRGRVQTGKRLTRYPTDLIQCGGSSPGSSDAEACAPSGTRLERSAEARSRFGSTRSTSDRSRSAREPTLTSRDGSAMSDRPEATRPPRIPTEAGLLAEPPAGKHGFIRASDPGPAPRQSRERGAETARPSEGDDRSRHRPAGPYALASEQEQKRLSATSSDCE